MTPTNSEHPAANAREVLAANLDLVLLPDQKLQAVQLELLSHAVEERVLSLSRAPSAIPEAGLLLRVTREVDRRKRGACSPLNRLVSRRKCKEWSAHMHKVRDLEIRLQAEATKNLL
ncbi:MAG: hypothetical protein O3C10_08325 [Chloroflexi bacterium]|nr:hypothetical protein [Chloroflexota bacterium]